MAYFDQMGCKKRKRGERVFKFKTFGEQGHPVEFKGSFRQNVKSLLAFGNLENSLCGGLASWSFQLEVHRNPPDHILLFVVEEPIEVSLNRHCKHCLHVGWGNHLICNKKYHFLVSSKETVATCFGYYEGNSNESYSGTGKFNLVEFQGHVMHGVFHSNGFGHLLCINGVEMGSDLAGYQIMEFWDRLCTGLQARKVSLTDNSHKRSMDLRLLYGVAYSEPWFGRWGYKFGRGSFGVTQQMYRKAIQAIQNIPLCLLAQQFGNSSHDITSMFSRYQTLSGHFLITLSDLLRFMLELKACVPSEKGSIDTYHSGVLVDTPCRWSPKRVEMATRVIVEALKKAEFRWVSRQEVRDAARAYIGDTGLLDFVLKSLGNHVVGNYLVHRCLNPVTKVLEYCLEDISNGFFPSQEGSVTNDSELRARFKITRAQLLKDMFCLYSHFLKEQKSMMNTGIFATISLASRVILNSKYLIKEYCGKLPSSIQVGVGETSNVYCTIRVSHDGEVYKGRRKVIVPRECFMLRNNTTFNELVLEAEKSFKEIYFGLGNLNVKSIANLNAEGTDLVFKVVKVGGELVFEGSVGENGLSDEDVFEGFRRDSVVDCPCGAKYDDGERMVSCDVCEVWQHTWCVGIPDAAEIPSIYVCGRCETDILEFPSLP
ncbi:hypothetical protein RJ639_045847 [Escallonia herrerae]|uniref:Zinc finger PHD-type domain-containing protein n=1 Tax=Escallonia herrerae TaxID=1293975 RepID=A0AA89AYZ2_9ASTE|nr:hypothetical protein RJ639_045847 [Escallonia herrerae]